MEEKSIRHIIYSDEFEEYYASMNEHLKKKDTRLKSKKPKTLSNVIWRIEYVET